MASFDKIAKHLMEQTSATANTLSQIDVSLGTLKSMVQNQEILIAQNVKIIELLEGVRAGLVDTDESQADD